jgi:hypothetical protein
LRHSPRDHLTLLARARRNEALRQVVARLVLYALLLSSAAYFALGIAEGAAR